MDCQSYRSMADQIALPCALVSVERAYDGGIRIVYANSRFHTLVPDVREGGLYDMSLPRDLKFEELCFKAAVLGQPGYIYINNPALGGWADEHMIPLVLPEDGPGYCLFTAYVTHEADPDRMGLQSMGAAEAALRASVTLMSAEDFREGVRAVLTDTQRMCGAHNGRVFLLDHDAKKVDVFCAVVDPTGIRRHNDALNYDLIQTWDEFTSGSSSLILASERDMDALAKRNPAWVANLRDFGVKSLVLIPLRRGNKTFGFVDFVNFDTEKRGEIQKLAELISIYLGTEISNYLLMERLEEVSTTDALTGLKNRTAMHHRIESVGARPFGIVNLDLNGLKRMNDTGGHDAGDRLLIMAAEALKKAFYFSDIFRTGGDEFIVILPGIDRETFYRKLERFRYIVGNNPDLSFAMGVCWSDGSVDITTAFRVADEAMYEDKKAYYRRNPHLRRP